MKIGQPAVFQPVPPSPRFRRARARPATGIRPFPGVSSAETGIFGFMPTTPKAETPPSTLDAAGKALWKSTRRQLVEQGTWENSDYELLGRFVNAVMDGRAARARIAKARAELGDAAYTSTGSMGQPTPNPDIRVAREAATDASAFGSELLLSPKARRQHGLRVTTSQGFRPGGKLESIFGPKPVETP
jgi:P27 family predicted phage terminase small subunit